MVGLDRRRERDWVARSRAVCRGFCLGTSGAAPHYMRLATNNKSKSYRKAVDLIFAALSAIVEPGPVLSINPPISNGSRINLSSSYDNLGQKTPRATIHVEPEFVVASGRNPVYLSGSDGSAGKKMLGSAIT